MRPAGDLYYRVEIYNRSLLRASDGDAQTEWVLRETRWAAIEPGASREYWQAGRLASDITHTITMRTVDISPRDQIRMDGRIFHICGVIHVVGNTICGVREEL